MYWFKFSIMFLIEDWQSKFGRKKQISKNWQPDIYQETIFYISYDCLTVFFVGNLYLPGNGRFTRNLFDDL